jgi:hypothetical protein
MPQIIQHPRGNAQLEPQVPVSRHGHFTIRHRSIASLHVLESISRHCLLGFLSILQNRSGKHIRLWYTNNKLGATLLVLAGCNSYNNAELSRHETYREP